MPSVLSMLVHHTYALLFAWVLVEQGGVPIPTVPLFIAAGTMSAAHQLHIAYALPVILAACMLGDSAWYFLGKRYGARVLNALCHLSLEAATCVERTHGTVSRRGALTLLFAKFVPGLNTVAAPIAGQVRIPFFTFAVYDLIGSLAWGGAWLFAGRFFGDIARKSSEFFAALGHFGVGLVLLAVFSLVIYRVLKRRQFLDELEGLRLEPRQLMEMIAEAERDGLDRPFIVDLRHPLDVLTDPLILPGALRIGPDELKQRREIIPNDRDIVLYCTCPSEETSAKVALELHRLGVHRVRPLRGGLQGWKDAGYPVDKIAFL